MNENARRIYEDLAGHYDYRPRIDIERVVIIRLPKDDEWEKARNRPKAIHQMLATRLSNAIQPVEKLKTLDKDFHIPVTETLQKEVENMCNYSSAISNESYTKGRNDGRHEGYDQGRNAGYTEGSDKRAEEVAIRMIRAGKLNNDEIAAYSGLSISRVKTIRQGDENNIKS